MHSIARILALGLIVNALVGCAATPEVARAGDASSPTGGIALLYTEREVTELRNRRYELDADGTLRVGSGRAAMLGNTDWTGTATAEQIAAIVSAAKASGIFDGPPACEPRLVDDDETIFTTIEFALPKGDRRGKGAYRLEGYCPTLIPLREAFANAALVRFNKELQALPEPGLQKPRGR